MNVSWLAPVFKRVFYDLLWMFDRIWLLKATYVPKRRLLGLLHGLLNHIEITRQLVADSMTLRPGNGICERKSGTTWKITTWLTFPGLFITAFRISKDLQRLVNAWLSCRSSSMQRWSKLTQTPRRNPLELQPYGQERSFSCKKTLRKVGRFPCDLKQSQRRCF